MECSSTVKRVAVVVLLATLTACGGGGGSTKAVNPNVPTANTPTSNDSGLVSVSGKAEAGSTITVTFPDGSIQTTVADNAGNYSLTSNKAQTSGTITVSSTDSQGNKSADSTVTFTANLDNPNTIKAIYLATGTMPELPFKPSLGINTEGPQGGADTAGMPMPFVDIFRTARPFKESQRIAKTDSNGDVIRDENDQIIYIQNSTTYDENGWPTTIDPNKTTVSASLLQGSLKDSIPEGQYTVLYEGSGKLSFSTSGSVSAQTNIPNQNKILLDIKLQDFIFEDGDSEREKEQTVSETNQIYSYVSDISNNSYVKNIRIIMPGGTCTSNPFIRVDETDTCPNGTTYESFEERLQADRNAIIFNPDYLMLLRNFKVIRMMNLMEASLKKLCYTAADCPVGVGTWDHRAKMDDSAWGGNDGRTVDEDHKGVPVSVMIALANTLKRDIWVNMPHVSGNDYVKQYAKQVKANLDTSLKVYIEYSNEVWNSGFAGYAYSISEGNRLGLNDIPADAQQYCDNLTEEKRLKNIRCHGDYYARLNYYSKRAVEIFDLWEAEFGTGNSRMVRVLGSFIGDTILTKRMLENVPTNKIDSVAIAPYFFGCPYRDAPHNFCTDAQKVLTEATTVDDIFDIIDQTVAMDNDVKGIDGTIEAVKRQLAITNLYNLKLISYEGGQHLVTGVLGKDVSPSDQIRLRKLFNDANRDPRMKQRYMTFMEGWKALADEGTTLFTLYTMPQSYYRYGNFGIKEHLNKSRAESPKYDGIMSFQEAVGNCWWEESGCTP